MEYSFLIGRRQCGDNKILVVVKYTIKARQINFSTIIYAVGVTLVDGNKNKDQWVLGYLYLAVTIYNYRFTLSYND